MSMLLVPLVLGAGAVGVYYLTRKNRGKKHSSRRIHSSISKRSIRGGEPVAYTKDIHHELNRVNLNGGKKSRKHRKHRKH